MVYNRGTTPN